jgi:hypothetical protein
LGGLYENWKQYPTKFKTNCYRLQIFLKRWGASKFIAQGLAQQLANHLKAPCYALSELKAESLYHAVKACPEQCRRDEMAKPMKK